mmetsp:Transcript_17399/g.46973  ORF Transcript_17399/g.46973 Transcript_17399/m.46973 type:complete len:395 (-) Transcript_17399:188-1372(-)
MSALTTRGSTTRRVIGHRAHPPCLMERSRPRVAPRRGGNRPQHPAGWQPQHDPRVQVAVRRTRPPRAAMARVEALALVARRVLRHNWRQSGQSSQQPQSAWPRPRRSSPRHAPPSPSRAPRGQPPPRRSSPAGAVARHLALPTAEASVLPPRVRPQRAACPTLICGPSSRSGTRCSRRCARRTRRLSRTRPSACRSCARRWSRRRGASPHCANRTSSRSRNGTRTSSRSSLNCLKSPRCSLHSRRPSRSSSASCRRLKPRAAARPQSTRPQPWVRRPLMLRTRGRQTDAVRARGATCSADKCCTRSSGRFNPSQFVHLALENAAPSMSCLPRSHAHACSECPWIGMHSFPSPGWSTALCTRRFPLGCRDDPSSWRGRIRLGPSTCAAGHNDSSF